MKLNKCAAAFLIIMCSLCATANAQIQSVDYSPSSGVITARGAMEENEKAFLTVIKNGSDDFSKNIVYQNVATDARNGEYSEIFKVSEEMFGEADDEYKIVVKESMNGRVSKYSFALAKSSVLDAFKNTEDKETFMKDNRYKLGLYLDGIEIIPNNKAILSMMQQTDYSKDADELCKIMQNYMLYDYIHSGNVENLFKYSDLLGLSDFASMKDVFTADRFSKTNQKDATSRLKNKHFVNVEEFEKELNEACVLAVVKNSNGYGNVEHALKYFADEIGIDTSKGSQKIYTMLQNKDFASYSELKAEFNRLANKSDTAKPSYGGGGGSTSVIPTIPSQINKPVPVADNNVKRFVDMTGFDWASEAVEYLRDKNVISGKEPGKFYPSDYVTRSEFVKMIVNAFNIKDGTEDMTFADVDIQRWDYKYINAAYSAGIIKGYSNEYFGCNMPISRQDIAVIVNRIKNFEGGELADRFDDDRQIAEYAYNSVYNLRFKEIIKGDGNNCFKPNDNATRAETALIIYSVIK